MVNPVRSLLRTVLRIVPILALLPAPGRGDVTFAASVGFDNFVKAGEWAGLAVHVTGEARAGDGSLTLRVRGRDGVRTYVTPVKLGSPKVDLRRNLYFIAPEAFGNPDITVSLQVEGRTYGEKKIDKIASISPELLIIIGLSADQSGLNHLTRTSLGSSPSRRRSANSPFSGSMSGQMTNSPPRILYPGVPSLPDLPIGYNSVDIVALGDIPLDSLTDGQWSAISGWVRNGGTLVISSTPDINRLRSRKLSDLLPVEPRGIQSNAQLGALKSSYKSDPPGRATVTESTLKPGSLLLSGSEALPLVVVGRHGHGRVIFTAFDLMSPEFRAWGGQSELWTQISGALSPDLKATTILEKAMSEATGMNFFRSSFGSNNLSVRQLQDALAGEQSTQTPSFTFIGIFLLAYIVLLVPVNYLLLKKRDKRELAWITAPVIIVAFTGGAYGLGRSMKGSSLLMNYCSVVEGVADSPDFRAQTITSIFSPGQGRYDLSVADPGAVLSEVAQPGDQYSPAVADYAIRRDDRTRLEGAQINMWDHRSFAVKSVANLGGAISATVTSMGAGKVSVKVTNGAKIPLESLKLIAGPASASVGSLGVGESRAVEIVEAPDFPATGIQGPNPDGRYPDSRLQSALITVLQSNDGGVVGTGGMLLTGWFKEPAVGISLDGEKPTVQGSNLLVLHIPRASDLKPRSLGLVAQGSVPSMPGFPGQPMVVQNAGYWNSQAYVYASAKNYSMALKAAEKAHAMAPSDGNITDTLAEMLQRLGKTSEAIKRYEESIRQQNNQVGSETLAKYGLALLQAGKKDAAKEALERASKFPQEPYGAVAIEQLKDLSKVRKLPDVNSSGQIGRPSVFGGGGTMLGGPVTPPSVSAAPSMPRTGKGKRSTIQTDSQGGRWQVEQEWDFTNGNSMQRSNSRYLGPAGRP